MEWGKMQRIVAVLHKAGVEVELHGEHDIIYLSPDKVPEEFHDELETAGAHIEDGYWAVYC